LFLFANCQLPIAFFRLPGLDKWKMLLLHPAAPLYPAAGQALQARNPQRLEDCDYRKHRHHHQRLPPVQIH
jgi:hypothetical protein